MQQKNGLPVTIKKTFYKKHSQETTMCPVNKTKMLVLVPGNNSQIPMIKFTVNGTRITLVYMLCLSGTPEAANHFQNHLFLPSFAIVRIPLKQPKWERFRGHDYLFSEEKAAWLNSQLDCKEWKSDLVIIDNSKELVSLCSPGKKPTSSLKGLCSYTPLTWEKNHVRIFRPSSE